MIKAIIKEHRSKTLIKYFYRVGIIIRDRYVYPSTTGTGGTNNARYCYSVWLRHLVMAHKNGLRPEIEAIAELGPGDSLGIGLAALLSGANKYYALDIMRHFNYNKNIQIFKELVELFSKRENIPDGNELPVVRPALDCYDFPSEILSAENLANNLSQSRVESIERDLLNLANPDYSNTHIKYLAPWDEINIIERESIDFIYSQAVLEHVDDLEKTYNSMYLWLKKGGVMSHQVDFSSHNVTDKWNGHWQYSDFLWKLIRGRRTYLINRCPLSTHLNLLEHYGFSLVQAIPYKKKSEIARENLAKKFRTISDEDLNCCAAFIQAEKI